MTALTFQFEKTHPVRSIVLGSEPWFVAADVCKALQLTNSRVMLKSLDDDEKGVSSIYTPGGEQKMAVVNESGLYTLILRCRDAVKAGTPPHRFRKWVTSEVLPAIRKTGGYQFSKSPGDALTIEQADLIRNMLNTHCSKLPKERQGPFLKTGWSKLKSHFKVGYRQIPQEQITEALSIVTRHAAEWELVEDEVKRPAQVLPDGRWLVEVEAGRIATCKDAFTYHSVPAQGIPALVREPGLLPIDLLPRIIAAANERLNIWVDNQLSVARHRVKPA